MKFIAVSISKIARICGIALLLASALLTPTPSSAQFPTCPMPAGFSDPGCDLVLLAQLDLCGAQLSACQACLAGNQTACGLLPPPAIVSNAQCEGRAFECHDGAQNNHQSCTQSSWLVYCSIVNDPRCTECLIAECPDPPRGHGPIITGVDIESQDGARPQAEMERRWLIEGADFEFLILVQEVNGRNLASLVRMGKRGNYSTLPELQAAIGRAFGLSPELVWRGHGKPMLSLRSERTMFQSYRSVDVEGALTLRMNYFEADPSQDVVFDTHRLVLGVQLPGTSKPTEDWETVSQFLRYSLRAKIEPMR